MKSEQVIRAGPSLPGYSELAASSQTDSAPATAGPGLLAIPLNASPGVIQRIQGPGFEYSLYLPKLTQTELRHSP